jgi:hypothetical protein
MKEGRKGEKKEISEAKWELVLMKKRERYLIGKSRNRSEYRKEVF